MAARALFVAGTDTGVGKTHVAVQLVKALREGGHRVAGYKPVACGDRDDAVKLLAVGSDPSLPLDWINPVAFMTPAAPLVAARVEGREIDFCAIFDVFEALASTHEVVIVEGAGGWEVPLTPERTMASLASELGAPVLLVAPDRLGVLNHVLLSAGAIRRRELALAGVLLNRLPGSPSAGEAGNLMALRALPDLPPAVVAPGPDSSEWLALARGWLGLEG